MDSSNEEEDMRPRVPYRPSARQVTRPTVRPPAIGADTAIQSFEKSAAVQTASPAPRPATAVPVKAPASALPPVTAPVVVGVSKPAVVSAAVVAGSEYKDIMEFKHISSIYQSGITHIERRQAGLEKSLLTPWASLNNATLNGLPWHSVLVAGARPGHGKTLLATQLTREGFILNSDQDYAVLDLQYEMIGQNMAIREYSMALKKSVRYLKSAEKGSVLTKADMDAIKSYARRFEQYPIYVDEQAATVVAIESKIERFYKAIKKPFVVTLDHTILAQLDRGNDERSKFDMLYNMAEMFTRTKRKFPMIWIVLTQLSKECEKLDRVTPGTMANFLQPGDVWGADAFNMHTDIMLGLLLPHRLHMDVFGPTHFQVTKNLVVNHILKCREAEPSVTFLEGDFANMRLKDFPGGAPRELKPPGSAPGGRASSFTSKPKSSS